MKKSPYTFSPEEYLFLHQIVLKAENTNSSKLLKKIKLKRGVNLDKAEIRFVKGRFDKWVNENGNAFAGNGWKGSYGQEMQ